MNKRRYVLTVEIVTDDKGLAAEIRTMTQRWAGQFPAPTGVRVTRQEIDHVIISSPVVLMERVLET